MLRRNLLLGALAAIGGVTLSGCRLASPSSRALEAPGLELSTDEEEARRQIEVLVPPGTDVDAARAILTSHGFTCRLGEEKATEVLFARLNRKLDFWVSSVWLVSLECEAGRIHRISVDVNFIGP